jgi:hypothetical protein
MAQCRVAIRGLGHWSRFIHSLRGPCSNPVPVLLYENFGRTSAPRLPQALQTKSGSMSESRTSSGQRSALVSM